MYFDMNPMEVPNYRCCTNIQNALNVYYDILYVYYIHQHEMLIGLDATSKKMASPRTEIIAKPSFG